MKSSVYPTPKRGDLTGQGEIEIYLTLVGGNQRLVPMLARHILKTRNVRRLLIHLGGSLTHEAYTCKHKLIASLSLLCSLYLCSYLLELTQTLWKLASRLSFTYTIDD